MKTTDNVYFAKRANTPKGQTRFHAIEFVPPWLIAVNNHLRHNQKLRQEVLGYLHDALLREMKATMESANVENQEQTLNECSDLLFKQLQIDPPAQRLTPHLDT